MHRLSYADAGTGAFDNGRPVVSPESDAGGAFMKNFVEEAMEVLEGSKKSVELFTGVKNQFISAGWDERVAEQMVLQVFIASNQTNAQVSK